MITSSPGLAPSILSYESPGATWIVAARTVRADRNAAAANATTAHCRVVE
jgi:hypothetical protein